MNPTYIIALKSILILSFHVHLGLPVFVSNSPTKKGNLYAFRFFRIRATCSAHLMYVGLAILNILGDVYKSCSSRYFFYVSSKPSAYLMDKYLEIKSYNSRALRPILLLLPSSPDDAPCCNPRPAPLWSSEVRRPIMLRFSCFSSVPPDK
jgi:hypothetical protein